VRRRAAIDIGTNSVRLLVADIPDRAACPLSPSVRRSPRAISRRDQVRILRPVARRLEITRLGEGVAASRLLRPAAVARTAAVVNSFVRLGADRGVTSPIVAATDALRIARNPDTLLGRLRVPVRILSGEEEARLGYVGVLAGLGPLRVRTNILVVDIGGGSVELTWGTSTRVRGIRSLRLGAVAMTERFFAHDPPLASEVSALQTALSRRLRPVLARIAGRPLRVVGVGGTITTLAAIEQCLSHYDPERIHRFRLTRRAVDAVTGRLMAMTVAERRRLPGLQPERADIILAGAIVLRHLLVGLGCRQITVSEADLLWGLLLEPAPQGAGPR
jgi:exopolyphosphatase / guanosine-5'-triphosphate,3'-diphosphate pyrophosphatase